VRSVHPPEELLPAAQELARSFVRGRSPVALGLAKHLLYRHAGSAEPLEAHLSDSLGVYWTSLADGKEGVAAFLEKRPASFTGKASELPRID
jgi:enoyl-CoA hydratase/carnithine racemase